MANMTCPHCWGDKSWTPPCPRCAGTGMIPDLALGNYFMLSELLRSQTAQRLAIPNDPTDELLANGRRLVTELLDPVRALIGPIHIDSGLRLPAVNAAVGGASNSAHLLFLAGDCVPAAVSRRMMMDRVIASSLAYDQIIWEGSWVHLGLLGPGGVQRRQALMMFPSGGKPGYSPYDTNDPRVQGA